MEIWLTDDDEGQDRAQREPPHVLRKGVRHLKLDPALDDDVRGGVTQLILLQRELDALLPALGVEEAEGEDDLREGVAYLLLLGANLPTGCCLV